MKTIRTYLAGIGTGGSLLGAVIAAFVALGAIVAFDGAPGSTASADAGTIVVTPGNSPADAAGASVAPTGSAAGAVTVAAAAATAPGAAPASAPVPLPGPAGPIPAERPDLPVDDPTVVPGSPGLPGEQPVPVAGGDTAGLVDELDETVSGATGLDLGLGDKTKGITGIIDGAVNGLTGGKGLGLGNVNLPDLPKVIDLGGLNGVLPKGAPAGQSPQG